MREVLSVLAAMALLWPAAAAADNYNSADSVGWPSTSAPASIAAKPAPAVIGTADVSKGAFRQLSSGNQQIAEALFNSQSIGAGTRQAWSLDRIASTKQGGIGWGQVFQRMQAEGLIKERNLGNLLADSRRPAHQSSAPQRSTVIVTGAGKVYVAGGGRSGAGRSGGSTAAERRTAENPSVESPKPRMQVAQRPQKRPQGDGRGWIAAGNARGGNPAIGLSTASASQALNRGSIR